MTELKKRKLEYQEDEITPTPPIKFQKTQDTKMSPFEQVTDEVIQLEMYPFLKNQDLAHLSLVSKLQRNLTEDKRAIRFEQQEREKIRIGKEIKDLVDGKFRKDLKYYKRLIDDIWEIPFNASTWNRVNIAYTVKENTGLSFKNETRLSEYVRSKYTFSDFNGEIKNWSPDLSIPMTIENRNMTRDQKKDILKYALDKKFRGRLLESSIRDWKTLLLHITNEQDRKLFIPFVRDFYSTNKTNILKLATHNDWNADSVKYIQEFIEHFSSFVVDP